MSRFAALVRWRPSSILDSLLGRAPYVLPPPPGVFVNAGGQRLHYRVSGPEGAPPMVCIHGLLSSTEVWEDVRPYFEQRYRVYALDLPGHGYSERRDDFSMTLPDQADVVAAFIRELGLGPVKLVGVSMGGGIAMVLTSRHRELVDRLVLSDTVCYPFKIPFKGELGLIPVVGDYVVKYLYSRNIIRDYLRNDVYFNKARCTEEEVDRTYAHLDTPAGRRALKRAMHAVHQPDWLRDDIVNINRPTLILWGQDDKLIPYRLGPQLAKDVRGSTFKTIKYCGHVPMCEKPESFSKAVLGWLDKPPKPQK